MQECFLCAAVCQLQCDVCFCEFLHFTNNGIFFHKCDIQFFYVSHIHIFAVFFFAFYFCVQTCIGKIFITRFHNVFQIAAFYFFAFHIAVCAGIQFIFCCFTCIFIFQRQCIIFDRIYIACHIIFALIGCAFHQMDRHQIIAGDLEYHVVPFGQSAHGCFFCCVAHINRNLAVCHAEAFLMAVFCFDGNIIVICAVRTCVFIQFNDFTAGTDTFRQHAVCIVQHHCHFRTVDAVFGVESVIVIPFDDAHVFQQAHLFYGIYRNAPVIAEAFCAGNISFLAEYIAHRIAKNDCNIFSGGCFCAAGKVCRYHLHIQNACGQTISHRHLRPFGNFQCIQCLHIAVYCYRIHRCCRTGFCQSGVNHLHRFAVGHIVFPAERTVFVTAQQTFVCHIVDDSAGPGHIVDIFEICCVCCHRQAGSSHHCRQEQR